jgi:Na+/H+-dicarboxylate symporter
VIFLRAGALQACFVLLHPCLRILLAIYSEATACMRQLMCTAVSQIRLDQLVPLHHYAHLMYPACLFFLYVTPGLVAAVTIIEGTDVCGTYFM